MASTYRLHKLIALTGTASVAALLSSCSLPPDQAWRKIHDDGLIAYWSYEVGSQHADSHHKASASQQTPAASSAPAVAAPALAQTPSRPASTPGMLSTGKTLTAQTVPSLPGFVRSPYTNPPRLVDVKGATPGATMICPYTQRPFIIPADYINAPGPMIAENRTSPVKPQTKSETQESKPTSNATPADSQPKLVFNSKPLDVTESAAKSSSSKPATPLATSSSTPDAPASPIAAPEAKPVQEIPFGSAIAGRPGFVNSPFAAKHQLVDVTGLPPGMEVKCPYTGKLFRVPPQDVAASKPADTAPPQTGADEPKKN